MKRINSVSVRALAGLGAALIIAMLQPAAAAPDEILLTGRVVSTSGKKLSDIAVRCDLDTRPGPFIVSGTNADGGYRFTRSRADQAAGDSDYHGCEHLYFFDPKGQYATTSWPSGHGPYEGEYAEFAKDGGPIPEANGTLAPAGQISGTATDAKKRGLFGLDAEVHEVTSGKIVASFRTSPYGGYRILGLPPGSYKVKLRLFDSDSGFRPVYAGGGSTYDQARTVTVKAGQTTALGRTTVPNTKPLFTSRPTPKLEYPRPLVSGTRVTVNSGAYKTVPTNPSTTFVVTSRAFNPALMAYSETSPWASAVWDEVFGTNNNQLVLKKDVFTGFAGTYNFMEFAERPFVVVAVHRKSGYAKTTVASAPTVRAQ